MSHVNVLCHFNFLHLHTCALDFCLIYFACCHLVMSKTTLCFQHIHSFCVKNCLYLVHGGDFMCLSYFQGMQLAHRPNLSICRSTSAPITGCENHGLLRSEIKQGIREVVLCKNIEGKLGLLVRNICNVRNRCEWWALSIDVSNVSSVILCCGSITSSI